MTRFGTTHGVSRPTGCCAATDEVLVAGTTAMATLCERDEDEGFDRVDYALEAWERGERPPRLFSHWHFIVPDADAKPGLVIDDAVLLDIFERLDGDQRPRRIAFRYILALVLMRKRQLKLEGREEGKDGGETWLMRFRGVDGEPTRVLNPGINEDEIRDLGEQLCEVLQGDL